MLRNHFAIEHKFDVKNPSDRETKICAHYFDYMDKMTAMFIYIRNHLPEI